MEPGFFESLDIKFKCGTCGAAIHNVINREGWLKHKYDTKNWSPEEHCESRHWHVTCVTCKSTTDVVVRLGIETFQTMDELAEEAEKMRIRRKLPPTVELSKIHLRPNSLI